MKKKQLDAGDRLDSIVICKTMNLEKNLPLVILEVELSFEIKDVVVELPAEDVSQNGARAFHYTFFDSICGAATTLGQDRLQRKMGGLSVKDTYSELFKANFKENEYLGETDKIW